MSYNPTCSKCGEQHYNFQKCEAREKAKWPEIQRSMPEGFRPWGDRFDGVYERTGENVFMLKKKEEKDA